MKKFLLVLMLCISYAGYVSAQTTVNEKSIRCEQGFELKEGEFKIGKTKYHYGGIYTLDGKVCIRCNIMILNSTNYVDAVAPGTEVIASGALTNVRRKVFYIPKSVKEVQAGALVLGGRDDESLLYISIYDDSLVTEHKIESIQK